MVFRALAAGALAACLAAQTGLAAEESKPTTLVYPVFGHSWGVHRATPGLLRLYVGDRAHFDDPQGIAVTRLVCWDDQTTEHDDDEITAYGVNSGEANIIYNTSMYALGLFGARGSGDGAFDRPRGIAADEFGNVYVADTGNNRVVHLWNSGKQLAFAGSLGSKGDAAGCFNAPRQVALDSQGNIYVTDWGNERIQVFGPNGALKVIFPGIPHPDGIAVNDSLLQWSYHKENALYVSTEDRREMLRLGPDGRVVRRARASDTHNPAATFAYLALDYYDNVYATDPANHCLHKFDRDLNYIVSYGKQGKKHTGEFLSPRGIAIWRRFGQVLIAEQQGAQYYWIGSDLLGVNATFLPQQRLVCISFRPTEYSFIGIEVLDGDRLVRRLWEMVIAGPKPRTAKWDLLDSGGSRVGPGTYDVVITVEPTYSSYKHFQKHVTRSVAVP